MLSQIDQCLPHELLRLLRQWDYENHRIYNLVGYKNQACPRLTWWYAATGSQIVRTKLFVESQLSFIIKLRDILKRIPTSCNKLLMIEISWNVVIKTWMKLCRSGKICFVILDLLLGFCRLFIWVAFKWYFPLFYVHPISAFLFFVFGTLCSWNLQFSSKLHPLVVPLGFLSILFRKKS